MSILIKGIDLPTSCENCFAYHSDESGYKGCFITMHIDTRDECQSIQTLCPLIEIPTPHGRLIDGEKLCYEFIDWQYAEAPDHLNTKEGRMVTDHERQYEVYLALGEAVIEIANAPTILEAEE